MSARSAPTDVRPGIAHHILVFRMFGAIPRLLLQALSPQLVRTLGAQPADIALMLMLNVAVSITVVLLYPQLAKHASIGCLLVIGAVLSSATLISMACIESFDILTIIFCLAGSIGWVLLGLQCPQHLVANLPQESLAANMRALTAGPLVSGLIVPPAVLWVSEFIRWQVTVLCVSVLMMMLCLISASRVKAGVQLSSVADKREAQSAIQAGRRVGIAEYAAITLSGVLAGFFTLHFVFIVDEAFMNPSITAAALLASGLTALASVFAFTRMQASGKLFRNLVCGSMRASVACLATAAVYQTMIGVLCLLAWPALSTGYFMHSMSVAASYDRAARVSGHLVILHMGSAGAGAYLFSWAVQESGSYTWPLSIISALSLAVSLLLIASPSRGRFLQR